MISSSRLLGVELLLEIKKTMNTPLRNAINSRRKSYTADSKLSYRHNDSILHHLPMNFSKSTNTPKKGDVNFQAGNINSVVKEFTKQNISMSTEKKSISIHLKEAIQARRKSYSKVESSENDVVEISRVIKTPLRQAINARRKSYDVSLAVDNQKEEVVVESIKGIKTPLKHAINARRQSYGKVAPVIVTLPVIEQNRVLVTSLMQSINSRRKSYSATTNKIDNVPSLMVRSDDEVEVRNYETVEAAEQPDINDDCIMTELDDVEVNGYNPESEMISSENSIAITEKGEDTIKYFQSQQKDIRLKPYNPYRERKYGDRVAESVSRQRNALRQYVSLKPVKRRKLRNHTNNHKPLIDDLNLNALSIKGTALQISIHALTNELSCQQVSINNIHYFIIFLGNS